MVYIPGHSAVVMAKADPTDPLTLTTNLGNNPSFDPSTDIIGYVDVPDIGRTEGGRKVFGNGTPYAVANGKGRRESNLTLNMRITSLAFINDFCLRQANGTLNRVALAMAIPGVSTRVIRYARCNQLQIAINEESDGEITANAQFMGIGEKAGTIISQPSQSTLAAPGSPLYFHNVANVFIPFDRDEQTGTDYRAALMSANLTVTHNLETKGIRFDEGDDNELSRRPYDYLPHTTSVSGDFTFHSDLPASLFTADVNSTSWGNVGIYVDDTPAIDLEVTEPKSWLFTLYNVIPTNSRQNAVDVTQQMNFSVSVLADTLTAEDMTVEEEEGGD